jgi:hypothetical protein
VTNKYGFRRRPLWIISKLMSRCSSGENKENHGNSINIVATSAEIVSL